MLMSLGRCMALPSMPRRLWSVRAGVRARTMPPPRDPAPVASEGWRGLRTSQPANHYPLNVGTVPGPCRSFSRLAGIFTESSLVHVHEWERCESKQKQTLAVLFTNPAPETVHFM